MWSEVAPADVTLRHPVALVVLEVVGGDKPGVTDPVLVATQMSFIVLIVVPSPD